MPWSLFGLPKPASLLSSHRRSAAWAERTVVMRALRNSLRQQQPGGALALRERTDSLVPHLDCISSLSRKLSRQGRPPAAGAGIIISARPNSSSVAIGMLLLLLLCPNVGLSVQSRRILRARCRVSPPSHRRRGRLSCHPSGRLRARTRPASPARKAGWRPGLISPKLPTSGITSRITQPRKLGIPAPADSLPRDRRI